MVRLVFTADNHLNKFYAKMTPEQLAHRRRRLRETWTETVEYALREGADFYLHGGDLFDSPNPRPSELVWAARQFERLRAAGILVYAIGGNHDIPKMASEGATPQRIFEEARQIHIFGRPTDVDWQTQTVNGTRIAIGGLPSDPRLGRDDDPLEDVDLTPPDAEVAILMLHYALEGTLTTEVNEPIIPKQRIADMHGIDLVLVGHVHERKTMRIGDVTVAFPGPTERMNFGELGVKPGFIEVTIEGGSVNVRHHDIRSAQRMRREKIRTTDLPKDDPTEALKGLVRALGDPDQLLQIQLEGPMDLEMFRSIRWWEVRHLGTEANFFFDLDRHAVYLEHEAALPVGTGSERVSPRAEMQAVAAALAQETDDPAERELLDEALELVLSRYGGEA